MERPLLGGEAINEMELSLDSPILFIFTTWSFLYLFYYDFRQFIFKGL